MYSIGIEKNKIKKEVINMINNIIKINKILYNHTISRSAIEWDYAYTVRRYGYGVNWDDWEEMEE